MAIFGALWEMINGKKFTTGTIVALAAMFIQTFCNVSKDEATTTVTLIMGGIGGVTALIGYIHRLIKSKKTVTK